MTRLLLLALGAALVLKAGPHEAAQHPAPDAASLAPPCIAVADDGHESLPGAAQSGHGTSAPDHPTDSVPNSLLMPPPLPPPAATNCVTSAGSCTLRAPTPIGGSCSCQGKTNRVFGSAQ
jgi:hypothetical protein